jgi:predicted oxidoreductase
MKTYHVSNTDLVVSEIALGCMRISSKSVEEVEVLVKTALDLGINFFDHADIYGNGKSELVFGEVLRRHPEYRAKMIIQTKVGIDLIHHTFDFSKDYILEAVEGCLQRLGIQTIDVLLLHRPDALYDPVEIAEAFDELYDQGKVRTFGVSNMEPSAMALIQKYTKHKLIANQLQFNVVHAFMVEHPINVNMIHASSLLRDTGLIDYCRLNDVLIQPWSVLQSTSPGSGTFIDNPEYPELNLKLQELSTKYKVTKSAISLAWILRHPAKMQPIVGTTNPIHLRELCEASKITLTKEEWYGLYTSVGRRLP